MNIGSGSNPFYVGSGLLLGKDPLPLSIIALVWLYLYSYVHPQTGQTEWFIIPRVNVQWFNLVLKAFAESVGAGKDKIILLVVDRAGWHRARKSCLTRRPPARTSASLLA